MVRALPEAHLKEAIIDKTVYKKGRREGHEEGAGRTLSGATGGEGCGHGGGMSNMQVWSSRHGAWCFHGEGASCRGGLGARDGEVLGVIWFWMGKSGEYGVRCINGCKRKRKGG